MVSRCAELCSKLIDPNARYDLRDQAGKFISIIDGHEAILHSNSGTIELSLSPGANRRIRFIRLIVSTDEALETIRKQRVHDTSASVITGASKAVYREIIAATNTRVWQFSRDRGVAARL